MMNKNIIIFALILLSWRSFGQSAANDSSFLPCLPKALYTVNRIKKVKNYRIVYLSNDSSLINYRVVTRKKHIANRERIKKGRRYKLEICPWGDRTKYYCMVDYLSVGEGVDIPIREEGQFPDVFYSFDLKGLYYVGGEGDSLRTEDF